MGTESLAAALEREHREIDAGIAASTASPWDPQPLARASRALRRHIYLEEEFLFPLLHQAEPALAAPIFVMLREHAQIWGTLDELGVPKPGAKLVSEVAAARSQVYGGVAHMVNLERPAELNALVDGFLDEVDALNATG